MSDFFQHWEITTFHILGNKCAGKIERELNRFSKITKITLIIPSLYSDYIKPATKKIFEALKSVNYINQVIIALDKATKPEFEKVENELKSLPINIKVLWVDNPKLNHLLKKLEFKGINLCESGKGKACWISIGYILVRGKTDVVVFHDADIVTYTGEMLSRLVYPVVNPELSFHYSKGFYARFSNKLYGRVTRLFIYPLVKTLEQIIGNHPLINYLNSFRYHLSGEFSIQISLAKRICFPLDWGFEISTLYEIYKRISLDRVCQVEISHRYDHKHQILSQKGTDKGLYKMVIDIAAHIFNLLLKEGVLISENMLKTISQQYLENGRDIISKYQGDAIINGLEYDREEEENIIRTFYNAFIESGRGCLQSLRGGIRERPMLPGWHEISIKHPGFLQELSEVLGNSKYKTRTSVRDPGKTKYAFVDTLTR